MKKLIRITGLNDSDIDTINLTVDILFQEPENKISFEDLQKRVMEKYLSGISVGELVEICRP